MMISGSSTDARTSRWQRGSAFADPAASVKPLVSLAQPDACVDVSLAWLAEREDAAAGLFAAFVRDHAPMTTPSTFA